MLYTKHTTLTDTTLTTLFAVPSGYHAVVNYVFVANHNGSTSTVDLYWDLGGVAQVYIFDGESINGGTQATLGNGGGPLFVLHENETVKCQAGGVGNMEVVVTFDLVETPASLVNFNGS
jgi:hypothetical protein